MWVGYHGPWCFGFFFLILIIGFLIVRGFAFRRGCRRNWPDEAELILRKRLVNGEISEEEYQKLKEALKR